MSPIAHDPDPIPLPPSWPELPPGLRPLLVESLGSVRLAENEWQECHREEIRLLWGSGIPECLERIDDPPSVLYLLGELPQPAAATVAVVGSRRALPAARREAYRLGQELASAGVRVVSGLARGIDTAVLEGAASTGGGAGAVLGNGLPEIYPAENGALAARLLVTGGFLLSELPLHAPPLRHHFPRRNRLISALSRAVVIVQASVRSGSLITAGWALEQGREVLAFPGPTEGPHYEGCHQLIRSGAELVTGSKEVLATLAGTSRGDLDPEDATLLGAWSEGTRTLEDLLARTGLPAARVLRGWLRLSARSSGGGGMS